MTLQEKQETFIRDFNELDDWLMQYAYLVENSGNMEQLEDSYKTDDYLVTGCQSKLWIALEFKDRKISIKADSDALIVKGMLGVVLNILNGQTPEDILKAEITFIEKTPLKKQLSSDRFKGIKSVIEKIRNFSLQC